MTAIDRFLRYVTYDTQSDEHSDAIPSTAKQKVLGAALAEELAQMGLHNAHMDEYGYVYARRAGGGGEAPRCPLRGGRPGAQRGEGHRHEGRRV